MKPKHQRNHRDNRYIDEITEWQTKQYLPGAYIGGNLPPYLKYPNKKLSSLFFFNAFVVVILIITTLVTQLYTPTLRLVATLLYGSLGIIFFCAGVKTLKKH